MQYNKKLPICRLIVFLFISLVLSACANPATYNDIPRAYISSAETQPLRPAFQVIQTGMRVRILIFSDICFEEGTGQINAACYTQLSQLEDILKYYQPPFKIFGYWDPILGNVQGNVVTKQQAFAIATYLWMRGYSTKEVLLSSPSAYMQKSFLGSTTHVESNSVNRRVEIRNY